MLLESRCDASRYSLDGFGALHAVPFFSRANGHTHETNKLLISFRADVNMRAEPKGPMFWECFRARVHTAIFGLEASAYRRKLATIPGSSPLMGAAVMGDKALVKILLENDADLDLRNYRGDTAEDLAQAAGHSELLQLLATFSV